MWYCKTMSREGQDPTYEYSETPEEYWKRLFMENAVRQIITRKLEENSEGMNINHLVFILFHETGIDSQIILGVALEMVYSQQVVREGDELKPLSSTR